LWNGKVLGWCKDGFTRKSAGTATDFIALGRSKQVRLKSDKPDGNKIYEIKFQLPTRSARNMNMSGNGVCRPAWENRLTFSADNSYRWMCI
jgi:hypothetical protein